MINCLLNIMGEKGTEYQQEGRVRNDFLRVFLSYLDFSKEWTKCISCSASNRKLAETRGSMRAVWYSWSSAEEMWAGAS